MSQYPWTAYKLPGVAVFAGLLAGIMGAMNIIYASLLLFDNDFVLLTREGLYYFNVTAFAWVLLIFGIVQVAACIGILTGKTWGRAVGTAWASLVIVGHMFFLPGNPFWSLLIIALGVLIIYALSAGLDDRGSLA